MTYDNSVSEGYVAVVRLEIAEVPLKYANSLLVPVPVTGLVRAFCLPLNVLQSVLLRYPLTEEVAAGILTVFVLLESGLLKVSGCSGV